MYTCRYTPEGICYVAGPVCAVGSASSQALGSAQILSPSLAHSVTGEPLMLKHTQEKCGLDN